MRFLKHNTFGAYTGEELCRILFTPWMSPSESCDCNRGQCQLDSPGLTTR